MALPSDVTIASITFGPYTDASGAVVLAGKKGTLYPVNPATGKRINLVHVATGQAILPDGLPIVIGDDGTDSVGPVPHTDNPGLSTVGFAYRVEWPGIQSGDKHPSPGNKTFAVPAAAGATADFDLLDVAEAVPGVLVPVTYGRSAYDLAVANGFVGTEAAWLASLVGPQGVANDASVAAAVSQPLTSAALGAASVAAVRKSAVRPPNAQLSRQSLAPTVMSYMPATTQDILTPAINTVYDVDATNLKVTFVVPASGQVLVHLQAKFRNLSTGDLTWRLRDLAGTIPSSSGAYALVGKGQAVAAMAVRTIRVTVDSAGQPLVPGRTMTLKWAQVAGGDLGSTVYGGGDGPAIMRVEPVSNRLTERQVTVTERPVNTYVPLWLSHDRTTLIGASRINTGRISWSTDDGVTWTENPNSVSGLSHIRALDNGELAVFCGQGDSGAVWVSSGWAANKATATFTKTLDFIGSPPEATYGAHPAPWGVDAYGPIVLAAEYGPKNGPTDMARYCYLSEDYGLTWRIIFDLAQKRPNNGSLDAHLHGVCYDPWWDAIWLTQGDNSQRGTWVSYDRGETWLEIPVNGKQFTTILPMPECILLASDIDPDGIYRIPRTAKDAPQIEYALPVGGAGLNMIGNGWFRARGLPDAPALIAANAANNNPGRAWATYDGYTFREVWTDTLTYQDRGAQIAVGPTTTGTYHLHVIQDDVSGPIRKHIVLTPV